MNKEEMIAKLTIPQLGVVFDVEGTETISLDGMAAITKILMANANHIHQVLQDKVLPEIRAVCVQCESLEVFECIMACFTNVPYWNALIESGKFIWLIKPHNEVHLSAGFGPNDWVQDLLIKKMTGEEVKDLVENGYEVKEAIETLH